MSFTIWWTGKGRSAQPYVIDALLLGQGAPLEGPEGDLPLATAHDAAFLRRVELHRQYRLCGALETKQHTTT